MNVTYGDCLCLLYPISASKERSGEVLTRAPSGSNDRRQPSIEIPLANRFDSSLRLRTLYPILDRLLQSPRSCTEAKVTPRVTAYRSIPLYIFWRSTREAAADSCFFLCNELSQLSHLTCETPISPCAFAKVESGWPL